MYSCFKSVYSWCINSYFSISIFSSFLVLIGLSMKCLVCLNFVFCFYVEVIEFFTTIFPNILCFINKNVLFYSRIFGMYNWLIVRNMAIFEQKQKPKNSICLVPDPDSFIFFSVAIQRLGRLETTVCKIVSTDLYLWFKFNLYFIRKKTIGKYRIIHLKKSRL